MSCKLRVASFIETAGQKLIFGGTVNYESRVQLWNWELMKKWVLNCETASYQKILQVKLWNCKLEKNFTGKFNPEKHFPNCELL